MKPIHLRILEKISTDGLSVLTSLRSAIITIFNSFHFNSFEASQVLVLRVHKFDNTIRLVYRLFTLLSIERISS